jgi:serine protease AprX
MQRFALVASLVVASALAGAMPYRHVTGEASAETAAGIDAQVLEDTAGGRTGHFLVVLVPQADTHQAAAAAPDFEARGHSVLEALRWEAKASQPAVRAALDALGARYRAYWIVNAFAVEGSRAVVEAMAARPDVAAIESDRAFRVDLERPTTDATMAAPLAPSAIEWNVSWINAPAMWAQGYTGQGQTLANADTGVNWEHPALKSHYRGWNGSTADHDYNWWDAVHSDISGNGSNPCGFSSPVPCDDNGHGTHTTGIAVGDDGAGNQVGVAPGAAWIACRNMDENVGRPSTYIECMQFFMAPTDLDGRNPDPNRRPHAVGNSYSCPSVELCEAHSLQTALENLRAAGVFMAASAGNSGPGCSTIDSPPALEDSAITVGATGFQTDAIASYSSRGPVTVDGSSRRKPDLVTPGSDVRSSYPPEGYATLSGTSMASPHVAGAVLLLWSALPQLSRAVDYTEFVLGQTAMHLTSGQGCGGDSSSQVPNNVYGYGRIDVLAAYDHASQAAPVGGIAELPPFVTDPMADSSEAAIPCTAVVAAMIVGVVVVAAGARYARRRWLR